MWLFWSKPKTEEEVKLKRKYTLKRDVPNENDLFHNFQIINHIHNSIKCIDLRSICPPVYNQLELGSCTANSIAGAIEVDEIKQKDKSEYTPSRLFIYYNERDKESTVNEDSGASISDGIHTLNTIGYCPESMWPYDIQNFKEKPNDLCYSIAKQCCPNVEYKRVVHNLNQMKQCLINGYPIVFGMSVYQSFESAEVAKTGIVPVPKKDETCLGGHAILAVGFDDIKQIFIVRNSWGKDWGDSGYCYIPYEYMVNPEYVNDLWTVTKVT